MNLREYQYVLKVAQLQNMTKAAEALFITQPSLSHYIARVEEELGVQLFNRLTTPLSLTPAGEKYVETARMILELDSNLKKELTEIAKGKKGVITLGMSHARASFFLPYFLPAFRKKYPGIEVKTVENRSDLLEEAVAKGRCDLGILPFPTTGKQKMDQEVIFREELLLVSGQPLKEAKEGKGGSQYVDLGDLGDCTFSLLRKGHGIRTAVDVLFGKYGLHPRKIFETTSNETAYRLASVGMGLAIVPETTIVLSGAVEKPYLYSISPEGMHWEIGAVFLKRELLTNAQTDLIQLLQEIFSHWERPF